MKQAKLSYSRILAAIFFVLWFVLKGPSADAFLVSCMLALIVSSIEEINNISSRFRWMTYSYAALMGVFAMGKIYLLIVGK